jgi:hypothetical protein
VGSRTLPIGAKTFDEEAKGNWSSRQIGEHGEHRHHMHLGDDEQRGQEIDE